MEPTGQVGLSWSSVIVILYNILSLRPPLSKKYWFLSAEWPQKRPLGRADFFFPNFIFYKLECTGGNGKKKMKM